MEEVFMEFMTRPIFDTFLYESDYPKTFHKDKKKKEREWKIENQGHLKPFDAPQSYPLERWGGSKG